MKKEWMRFILVLVFIIILFYFFSLPEILNSKENLFLSPHLSTKKQNINQNLFSDESFAKTRIGMANPAAIYCMEMGYKCEMRNQIGYVVFPDSSECTQWDFLQGLCGQEFSYCAQQGYDLIIKDDGRNPLTPEYAVCVSNGIEVGSVTELTNLMGLSGTKISPVSELSKETKTKENNLPEPNSLPESFDWRNYLGYNWVSSVKDQGSCGSCWAHSSIGLIESIYNVNTNHPQLNLDLSEQYFLSDFILYNTCCGGDPATPYKKWQSLILGSFLKNVCLMVMEIIKMDVNVVVTMRFVMKKCALIVF